MQSKRVDLFKQHPLPCPTATHKTIALLHTSYHSSGNSRLTNGHIISEKPSSEMGATPLPVKPFSFTLSKSSVCTTARDTPPLWWRTSELRTTSSGDYGQEEPPAAVAGLDGLSSWDGTDSRHGAACQLPARTWKLWGKGEFENHIIEVPYSAVWLFHLQSPYLPPLTGKSGSATFVCIG